MLGLEYTQEQRQTLSQKMIQSAEILQMDVQELETYIQQVALENPLIDFEEIDPPQQDEDFRHMLEWFNQSDEQNRLYYQQECEEEKNRAEWNFSVEENSLKDYLMSQLIMLINNEKERSLIEFLVNSLDSKGYLRENSQELADELGVDLEEVERGIILIQSVEPVGVGARTLEECLLLQLDRLWEPSFCPLKQKNQIETLIAGYLELLGKQKLVQVSAQSEIPPDEVQACFQIIKKLNPIPGNSFSSRETLRYIQPDIAVVKFKDYFEILTNDVRAPRIGINQYYLNLLEGNTCEEVEHYVKSKYKHAKWVQHCVEERNVTLTKVVREIVDIQKHFFGSRDGHRIPMSLMDIADRLGLHESTVSRAVKGKFLQCAWGIYPLNYFFVKCAARKEGISFTPEHIKQKITEIIAREDKEKPLSDQKIAVCLGESGIEVSRRTVAKYRMEQFVPDASGRKNQAS